MIVSKVQHLCLVAEVGSGLVVRLVFGDFAKNKKKSSRAKPNTEDGQFGVGLVVFIQSGINE